MKFINKLTEIKIEYFMIFFLIIMILPFLILNFYNIPDPEDIHWTEVVKEVGYPEAQIKFRENWSGRFFSYALLSLNPLYFKSFAAHKILTLSMMMLMFCMIYFLISEIFNKSISANRKILFSLSVFFMYLYMMPIVSEGLYWMTSLYVYHTGIFLIILFFIFYIRYTDDEYSSRKKLYLILCSFTIIAISGCCEMAMPLVFILIISIFFKKLLTEKKADYTLIYFTILIFLSMYFVTTAPGNSIRSESFPGSHIFISSVVNSLILLSKKLVIWTIISPLIAVSLFLIPSINKFVSSKEKNLRIFSMNPVFPVLIWVLFLFMCIFLFYWSMGKSPYLRSLNFVYFIYLLGWFYILINILFYTYSKFNLLIKKIPLPIYAAGILILFIFLIRGNNVKSAYAELFGGSAKKYSEEMYQRFDYIKQSSSDSVGVDPVQFPSKFLFVRDIREDPGFWKNIWYAKFFNKKYIYLKKSSAQPEQ